MVYSTLKADLCQNWLFQSAQIPGNLHRALEEIAMKNFVIIPWRKIQQCDSLESAFTLLEKWKLLSSKRLSIIVELSDLLNGPTEYIRMELKRLDCNYENPSFCSCLTNRFNNSNQTQSGISSCENNHNVCEPSPESRFFEVYDFLSENMGFCQKWIDLGRKLPGMRRRTEELRRDFTIPRQKDKVIQLLEEFELSCREGNPLLILLHCLEQCELRRQSHIIQERFPQLLQD